MISRKQKDSKLMLSCTGGQRKKVREKVVKKMCGRGVSKFGGWRGNRRICRQTLAQGHAACACDLARLRASTVVFWKGGVMYETADRSLAERTQNLGQSPEVEHGLLPLFGTPLTAVWVSLQLLRDKKF